ncbi:MAG: aminotransferase class V-fold PLP-dependent enzyme [Gemmatimonadota bacterium]|nr:MAG: aminotransferase class V-fold PLP-dependent enzyme [Gemmatimonadota bacterium]
MFDLEAVRSEFPILHEKTYLNSCSLGALSHRAESYLNEFLRHWHTMGASAWYELWVDRIEDLRTRVATFLGASPDSLALLPSTSAALSVIAESVRSEGRNRVVCSELDFPTLAYQWAVKPEIELVVLPSDDGVSIDPQRFAEAVDERTLLLATSHVLFTTGYVQDIALLGRVAREAGAYSLIDGYQAPGQIPVDPAASGVDFYTCGPLKWLCGGPGLSYLWVRPELIRRLEPRITSWWAVKDMFGFDLENFQFRDDARRFELGTPALATVHTALGGQEIIDEVGIEAIHGRNRTLTDHLVEGALEAGFELTIAAEPERRSAIVMIQHQDAPAAVARLAERGIIVDHRPGHVRVSPHFYNTTDEIDHCVASLSG